jgi:hypothetical protein
VQALGTDTVGHLTQPPRERRVQVAIAVVERVAGDDVRLVKLDRSSETFGENHERWWVLTSRSAGGSVEASSSSMAWNMSSMKGLDSRASRRTFGVGAPADTEPLERDPSRGGRGAGPSSEVDEVKRSLGPSLGRDQREKQPHEVRSA